MKIWMMEGGIPILGNLHSLHMTRKMLAKVQNHADHAESTHFNRFQDEEVSEEVLKIKHYIICAVTLA
jgi:hypothetical protein